MFIFQYNCLGWRHTIGKRFILLYYVLSNLIFHSIIIIQRIHLDIQVGDQAIDYAQVAQKEKLSDLQLRIRQLVEQVEQITKEQSYQRVSII